MGDLKDSFSAEDAKKWITEKSVVATDACNEPGNSRFEWFMSEDGKKATILEIYTDSDAALLRAQNLAGSADKDPPIVTEWQANFTPTGFHVFGPVKKDCKDFLSNFGASFNDYVGGFITLETMPRAINTANGLVSFVLMMDLKDSFSAEDAKK